MNPDNRYIYNQGGLLGLTIIIDKVYIDGPCGSKTLAGVLLLLARFERVSHVTHFYK